MRYRVNWSYASSLGGPWHAGQLVELTEQTADAIDATSPGVLEPAPDEPAKGAKKAKRAPAKEGAGEKGTGTRHVKKPRTRAKTEAEADR